MEYKQIEEGIFESRPNRFIAYVETDGIRHRCHVKNTGRCRELLVPGARVLLEKSDNPNRKTLYDLVAVYKGRRLINMDSQAPNKVFYEYIKSGKFLPNVELIKPEYTYGESRIDFYLERKGERILAEVKGVTLEEDGVVRFPDAPTERGVKHIRELIGALDTGYIPYIIFVVQMDGVSHFEPNDRTHKSFGDALREAERQGVNIKCYTCKTSRSGLEINGEIPVKTGN